jgi:anti-sigma regulatory factor (Ser/Thr protein kinase)
MSNVLETFERQIPKHEAAAIACRRWLQSLILPLSPERHDDLVFLTNELVTNSVIHARGSAAVSLAIEILPSAVRVTVTDDGIADVLDFSEPDLMETSGRGLMLVRMIASRCGAWQVEGNSVWFEIDR